MRRLLLLTSLASVLTACGRTDAPDDVGVCWRMQQTPGVAPTFTALAKGIDDLETCAVLLEARRLKGERQVAGAYRGNFIFVDDTGIRSALSLNGFHYPIFQPPQRAAIDRDLTRIMKTDGGRLPDAAELSLERK